MRKTTSTRRPDLTLDDLYELKIFLVDVACPVHRGESYGNQQLAFETRERREGYTVEVTPFVIGCLGGGIKKLENRWPS